MKPKRMMFSAEMALAIEERRKGVTRRVVKFPEEVGHVDFDSCEMELHNSVLRARFGEGRKCVGFVSPYQVGQLLYVREPWQVADRYDTPSKSAHIPDAAMVVYPASDGWCGSGRKRLPRFMPARFARTFLRVTEVRCERLGDITEGDAIAEGVEIDRLGYKRDYLNGKDAGFGGPNSAKRSFASLWDSINKKGPKFADNPWVWVVSFERVEMPNPWNSQPVKP